MPTVTPPLKKDTPRADAGKKDGAAKAVPIADDDDDDDGKVEAKDAEETKPGYAPGETGDTGDAVPTETVGTADTGRVSGPKKQS